MCHYRHPKERKVTTDFQRDRYGRPLVSNPENPDTTLAYRRPSSYGSVLDDKFSLNQWQQRMALVGATKRPDLLAQIASTAAGDKDRGQTAELNKLIEECIEAAGGNEGRRLGDALHKYLALINVGQKVDALAPWDADIAAYLAALEQHQLRPVPDLVEVALVNDPFQAAGSADVFLEHIPTGDVYLADAKTGKNISSPNTYLVQATIYASSMRYDIATGTRTLIHPRLRTDVGIIIHIPAGSGKCELITLDLNEGHRRTILARDIHGLMKDKSFMTPTDLSSTTITPQVVVDDNTRKQLKDSLELLNRIILHENGKSTLARLWLTLGIPFPPKGLREFVEQALHPSSNFDPDVFALVCKALRGAEAKLSMPFEPEPKEYIKDRASKKPEPRRIKDVEGGPADRNAVAAVKKWVEAQPLETQTFLSTVAKKANLANGSISLRANPTVRRFEIARTFTLLEGMSPDDMHMMLHALLDHVGHDSDSSHAGTRLATVDSDTAKELSAAAQQLADGQLAVVFNDSGMPTLSAPTTTPTINTRKTKK